MLTAPRLQRSNPLTSGLLWAIAGGHPFDLVSGRQGATAGGATTLNGTSIHGGAFESTVTNGTNNISWPYYRITRITTAHSIMAVVDIDTRVDDAEVVQVPYSGGVVSPYSSLSFGDDGAGAPIGRMTVGTATVATYTPGGTLWQTGHHAYIWTRYGANQAFYRDGVLFASTSGGSTGTVDFGGGASEIDIYGFSVANPLHSVDGRTTFAGIWGRALTAGEASILTQNPSQLWTPKRSVAFPVVLLPPAAGGSASPTPSVVSSAGSVPAPTLTATASPSPSVVTSAASVPAPTVTASASVSVSAVVGVGTVQAPTLTATATVSPSAVAGVGVVQAPSVSTGADISVNASTVVAVGVVQAPTVTASATVSPSAVAGVGSVKAPTVTAAVTITVTTVAGVAAIASPTITASASIAATVVAALGVVRAPTITDGSVTSPGNATTSTSLANEVTVALTKHGATVALTSHGATTSLQP